MSVWIDVNDRRPPIDENVLILYKHRDDELKEENLYYGLSYRLKDYFNGECRWAYYVPYQGYYEVVYWTPLVDKPVIKRE